MNFYRGSSYKNITTSDKAYFDGDISDDFHIIDESHIRLVMPDAKGGDVSIKIKSIDGDYSNEIIIVVRPTINILKQNNEEIDKINLKEKITITGHGFSKGSTVKLNNITQHDYEFISSSEIRTSVSRPFNSRVIDGGNEGENVSLKVVTPTRAGVVSSDEKNVLLDTFNMIIFGDSIQWGQGLKPEEKIFQLVENHIHEKIGNIGIYNTHYAHSGAIIGTENNDNKNSKLKRIRRNLSDLADFGGEVPTNYPTVLEQVCEHFGDDPATLHDNDNAYDYDLLKDDTKIDHSVDLILVDGGINDVKIKNILNPLMDATEFDKRIHKYCYKHFMSMLKILSVKFPNAKIITTGYFTILSEKSNRGPMTTSTLAALGLHTARDTSFGTGALSAAALTGASSVAAAGLSIVGNPVMVGGVLLLNMAVYKTLIQRCKYFHGVSHGKILKAIDHLKTDTNLTYLNLSDRLYFADPEFTDENAIMAGDSLIYSVNFNLSPQDSDYVSEERLAVCELVTNSSRPNDNLENDYSHASCTLASVGHPTPAGARRYADKIISQLDATGLI